MNHAEELERLERAALEAAGTCPFAAGDTVRPAGDGEHLRWTAMRGEVVAVALVGRCWRVKVRWHTAKALARLYGVWVEAELLTTA